MTPHAPIVRHWPSTRTEPEEVSVTCTCRGFEYTSIESAGGPVEPWGEAFEEHVEGVAG